VRVRLTAGASLRGVAATRVALLRGINLGARNKIAMPALRDLFADLGAEAVETYVQSGNVVFDGRLDPGAIEARIKRDLGLEIVVLVRTAAELKRVVEKNPFAKRVKDPKQLHVTFLAEKPAAARVKELDPERSPGDEFAVVGREVYLHTPKGYGVSKLSNAWFEQKLGVAGTSRNWNTVSTLAKLARR
jgi:uncharacterized protein (DUF1697 family)